MFRPKHVANIINLVKFSCVLTYPPLPNYLILIAFPLQQWLHKHSLVLYYTYIALLVIFLSVLFVTLSVANIVQHQ